MALDEAAHGDNPPWLVQSMARCFLQVLERLELGLGVDDSALTGAMQAVASLFLEADQMVVSLKAAGRIASEAASAVLHINPPDPGDRRLALAWEAVVMHLYNCAQDDMKKRDAGRSEQMSVDWAVKKWQKEKEQCLQKQASDPAAPQD